MKDATASEKRSHWPGLTAGFGPRKGKKGPGENLSAKDRRARDQAREQARKDEKTPGGHNAKKVIDDITRSEDDVRTALERVQQEPSMENLNALDDAQDQLREIRSEFEQLRRRDRGIQDL